MSCFFCALNRQTILLFLSSVTLCCGYTTSVLAQPITAAQDGTGTEVQQQGDTFNISGGSQAGANQLHSFEQFGLEQQQTANFQTDAGTANVLGRVTGGDPSVINGTVRVTGSEANLYLMNPAGMVFGENARLDVPGSFHGTTADSIGFENGEFSATGQNNYQNLNTAPNRFNFEGGSNGAIVNQGDLAVNQGKNLSLTGSTVINTGTLTAPGGQAAVVAVPTHEGSQSVRISQEGMVMGLEVGADRLSQQNLSATDLSQNPRNLPKVLTGGTVDHATSLQIVDGRVYLRGSGIGIDPLTGSAVVSGSVTVASPGGLERAGQVLVQGDRVQVTGASLQASSHGSARSQIEIQGTQRSEIENSALTLSNLVGIGGLLKIQGGSVAVRGSTIAADGSQGGGLVQLQAIQGLMQVDRSEITATSGLGTGGRVEVLGDRVALLASTIEASGVAGGEIYIGGDYQGQGTLKAAQDTVVDQNSQLLANGLGLPSSNLLTTDFPQIPPFPIPAASGGTVILWADDRTRFYGQIQATGYGAGSRGGFVEVSGKETLIFRGQVNVGAIGGEMGTLLLDPAHITIVDGNGGLQDSQLSDGSITPADSPGATFTISETVLEAITGNIILQADET
ncbi:MAG: filamentous hemagglutinin N-terminal domain-containing protein, partial [Prochlorothrix sp.]|nr:filamentous hemagglutinin N-terminal domain-containing protein [Prochlorothrix sp.]